MAYSGPEVYSEGWHIQIFDMSINLEYSGREAYSESWYFRTRNMFGTMIYFEPWYFRNNRHIYNHFHNILRLFDTLPNFPITTSETIGDYYLKQCYLRVVSEVAERLKT